MRLVAMHGERTVDAAGGEAREHQQVALVGGVSVA